MNRRGFSLIEVMMACVLLELFWLGVPDNFKNVYRRERRADTALDRVAMRTGLSRQLRADLDRARGAQVHGGGVLLDHPAGLVTWTVVPGGLARVTQDDLRVWPRVALAAPPAYENGLLALELDAAGGARLVITRLWSQR